MNRSSETKFVSSYAAELTPNVYTGFNSIISGTTQFSSGLPPLLETAPGTDFSRQGTVVMPRQNKVAVDVRLRPTLNPVDITVVVYWGICKKYKTYGDVQANSTALCNELLILGGVNGAGAESQSFNGIASDSHLVTNSVVFGFQKKTFKLYKAAGIVNGVGTGVLAPQNKVQHSFMLDWAKMLPAKIKYDVNTDQYPTGYVPVWTMGYYYNDGTPPDVTPGSGIVEYKANRFLTFKDM